MTADLLPPPGESSRGATDSRAAPRRSYWSLRMLIAAMISLAPLALPAVAASAAPQHVAAVKPATVTQQTQMTGMVMAAAAAPTTAAPGDGALPAGYVETKWGPLGPADKDLLVRVRLAGLWEMPAGNWANERGASERVRQVGQMISQQHAGLDAQVRKAAADLNVTLPSEPNADQKKWLAEMQAATSDEDFDRIFVDRLRQAHGKIFPAIAQVRSGTRNTMVRDFAETANNAVKTHMTLLESTGLVNYESLPTAPGPSATGAAGQAAAAPAAAGNGQLINPVSSSAGGLNPMIILIVLAAATIAGGLTTFKVLRSR
jgi:putative membrane protein